MMERSNLRILQLKRLKIRIMNTYIQKTHRIIDEFRSTLNFKYPVAQEFENVYVMISEKLVYANMKKDVEVLQDVLKHLRSMRETWEEVMRLAKR
jgi:flagellar protein FliS